MPAKKQAKKSKPVHKASKTLKKVAKTLSKAAKIPNKALKNISKAAGVKKSTGTKIKKLSAKKHDKILTAARANTTKALHKALAALDKK